MKTKLKSLVFALTALVAGQSFLAAQTPPVPRVIHLTAGQGNLMKFDVTAISAAPGETITVVLTNAGTLPKTVMGHNWILLKAGSDPVAFAATLSANAEIGYTPTKSKEGVLAFIGLLGPKESGEVTFAAPTTPGDYPFLCAFPAHCLVGMKGVLTVK